MKGITVLGFNDKAEVHIETQFPSNICEFLGITSDILAGLAKIQTKSTLVIGVETDILFPVHQQQEIADGIRKTGRPVEFVQLNSINGHDSFLVDEAHFAPVMRKFFEQNANP